MAGRVCANNERPMPRSWHPALKSVQGPNHENTNLDGTHLARDELDGWSGP